MTGQDAARRAEVIERVREWRSRHFGRAEYAWMEAPLLDLVDAAVAEARREERARLVERIEYALRMTVDCSAETVRSHVREILCPPASAPEGETRCGIRGCTLPKTHGDEPHSWEPPTGQGIEVPR